jgi:hypothetical protein
MLFVNKNVNGLVYITTNATAFSSISLQLQSYRYRNNAMQGGVMTPYFMAAYAVGQSQDVLQT